MKLFSKTTFAVAAAAAFTAISANAATIVGVTGITGHDGGNWPDWYGHLTDMVNGSDPSLLDAQTADTITPGMDTSPDPADPATWTWSSGYQQTWHGNSLLDPGTSANSKLGWVVMDFGSVVNNLENAYFWASGQANNEHVNGLNLYYSSGAGIDALPAMPKSKGTTGDYDFSSGDWNLLTSHILGTTAGSLDSAVSMGGISAQYIGIEVMSLHGTGTRLAIGQVEFTAIPEPSSSVALFGLGGLGLLRRRRRRQ